MSGPVWRVLSTNPPGVFDGIGDFSAMLTTSLREFGEAELFVRDQRWSELARVDVANTAGAIVQYFPHAFLRGDVRALLSWLDQLRALNRPVLLTVHEYWPPLDGTVRRAVVRLLFRQLLGACIRRSTVIVTSQEFSAHELEPVARGRRVSAIPVGSNIPRSDALMTRGPGRRVVLFGQPASMHRATMIALGRWLASAAPDVSLTWLGRSTEEMRASWENVWRLPSERIEFAGGLPAAGVSAALQSAHVGLAPYENGASGRRGSFAALMEHGLPVVAVDGLYTSAWLRESGACIWTPEGDPPAFVNALSRLVDDAEAQGSLSARARAMFDARLAWPVIARSYARLLSEGASV